MRTTTLLLFSLLSIIGIAQGHAGRTAAELTAAVHAELDGTLDTNWTVSCSIAQFHQGGAGTGAALVMYAPTAVIVDVIVELHGPATDGATCTWRLRGTSRRDTQEAVERVAEAAADHIATFLRTHSHGTPTPELAHGAR